MSASSRVAALLGILAVLAGCESLVGIRDVEVEKDPAEDDKSMTSAGGGNGGSSSSTSSTSSSSGGGGKADASVDGGTPLGDDCDVVPGRIDACVKSTSTNREGSPCSGGCQCAADLVCFYEVGETLGKCIGVRKCGEPCTDDDECRSTKCSIKQCK